ncbi:cation diffusion facilitator family transporter [Thiosocius teredinicola]|uniref:cation diffusion facilitator family transporter n=1 Tax=Thiosocius teredinicola TaxID=1973002 RepID=UPI00099121E9
MHQHTHGSHGHEHHHAHGSSRRLLWALGLTLSFAVVEAVAGWWSGSLALLGDAGHMLTDTLALGLAAGAAMLAKRKPSVRHSYGLGRAEILAALINAVAMVAIVVFIVAEAVERFRQPSAVNGVIVMGVAFVGLLINIGAAWLLSAGHHGHDLNVRAALLHVLGDLLGSVAALLSGAVIMLTGWTTIDPLLSLLIVVLILVSALRILREALHALMEGVPLHLNLERIGYAMAGIDGVVSVHDLHVWSLSANRTALSAHLVIHDMADWPNVLDQMRRMLADTFDIDHVTLQPEMDGQVVTWHPADRLNVSRQGGVSD